MGIELLKGMLGILPKVFQQFFSCRKRKEVLMQELMNKDYFAALIMTLRKIHAKCSRLDVTTSREELLSIANIVVNELSPTAAQAGGYNHESVIKEFGSEMHGKLEKLLNVCADIDCLTAPGADIPISKNQILPACLNAQMIWNE